MEAIKEYRINSQNDVISLVRKALNETILGQGFLILCDIEYLRQEYSTTMVFRRKDGQEMDISDFFFLGYFVGRDFEKKTCNCAEKRQIKRLKKLSKRKKL